MEQFKAVIMGSGRHCHVTKEVFETLFGEGAELTPARDLNVDPLAGFLSSEKVTLVTPKKEVRISILGPFRRYTQVEISRTDAINMGYEIPQLSDSGKTQGTNAVKLAGPKGEVELSEGLMIVRRHVHLDPLVAEKLGCKKGDALRFHVGGPRGLTFEQVAVADNSPNCPNVLHLDYDELNALGITTADKVEGEIIFIPEDRLMD